METSVWLVLLLALCRSAVSDIPVRLVDGSKSSEGRVEVFINNTWWMVCEWDWYPSNAKVVCRQLGFSAGSETRIVNRFFGKPLSFRPMLPDWFLCSGSEFNISDCNYNRGSASSCRNEQSAGVVCESIVHPPVDVRLMDGRTSLHSMEGRVEVSSNGTWGTICDDKLDNNAARVICRMLGYNSGSNYFLYGSMYGAGSGPILITRLLCQSSDTNLTTCLQVNSSVFTCPSSQVASVVCNYTRPNEYVPLRLDGPSPNEGTLEVFAYGKWRKLCASSMNIYQALVVCRQLGWNISDDNVAWRYFSITQFTPFSDRVYVSYSCYGREQNIVNCSVSYPFGYQTCVSSYEFGVSCYPDQVEVTTKVTSTTTKTEMTAALEVATETTADKGELNVIAVILGATLALSLIVILIFVIFLIRNRLRGVSYMADGNRDSQQPAGQRSVREEFYQNAAFHSQAEAAASPASSAPPSAEQDHFYEILQGREASRK